MRPIKLIIKLPKTSRLIALLILPGVFLMTAILFFTFRTSYLQHQLNRMCSEMMSRAPRSQVGYKAARFVGLSDIVIEDIHIVSADRTQNIDIGSCEVHLAPTDLIRRRIAPKRVSLNDLNITIQPAQSPFGSPSVQEPSGDRYPERVPARFGFAAVLERLLNRILQYTPEELHLHGMRLRIGEAPNNTEYRIADLTIKGPVFKTPIILRSPNRRWSWLLQGKFNRNEKAISFTLHPCFPDTRVTLPFLERRWNLGVAFDSASAQFRWGKIHSGVLPVKGSLLLNGLELKNSRIAAQSVQIEKCAFDYHVKIGSDSIELIEPSSATLNQLTVSPRIRFSSRHSQELSLRIKRQKIKADHFFRSLPSGLFSRLSGIDAEGEISIELNFFLDFSRPEALILDPIFEMDAFQINQFGNADFREINEPFSYDIFENEQWQRSIELGPDNPDYRPLDEISPFLRNAVLICEDGGFYHHKGFLLGPFKDSIVANLKAGSFVRGGSTITMQLVKNLYLKRNKTIARKLEEMIITWIIEGKKLVSKERLFEVYLNIIEWGPGIYGIQEAARFYFQKDAQDLNLTESIFLASIIPRPRRFMVAFDREQKLKDWMVSFYEDVSAKMLQREMISQEEFDRMNPDITLSGPAQSLLRGINSPRSFP